jgi:SWI/SNF-related matrix-associated actin-dependent regulator of chromatin subfamily A3
VMIKREPGNPHDKNAIRIDNVQGAQIGHIPRNLAAKLASYLVSTPRASH